MIKKLLILASVGAIVTGCCGTAPAESVDKSVDYDKDLAAFYGVPEGNKLSLAMQRAMEWDTSLDNKWFIEFEEYELKGDFAPEEGVVRRDPSAIIEEDGLYYCWYTRSTGKTDGFAGDIEHDKVFPWDRCDIWYATSEDGLTWDEQGPAIERGEPGSYDDRSVFTTEIMKWEDKYYLCYQVVANPYSVRVYEHIAIAWADNIRGPWHKSDAPIVSPSSDTGIWKGTEDNRFMVEKKGDFDSHKTHDPCILPFNGKFYLYYKGERMGEEMNWGGREIKHGVAIADNPLGPYVKSEYNPISNSGHEICVWNYNGGIASLITTDGPEKNTVQWSPDGINFKIMAVIPGASHAIGLNRTADAEKEPTEILRWGLTHHYDSFDWQSIRGFRTINKTSHTAKGEANGSKK